MEPRIQYAKTSDGVNIAYAETGEGHPIFVMAPAGFSHIEFAVRIFATLLDPLIEDFHTIWFDPRGCGLSDRDVDDFSVEALTKDLEAVVERTRVDSMAIAAWTSAAPIAVNYVAAHPERVSHLVLVDSWAKGSDWTETAAAQASTALLKLDWSLFTETFGQVLWSYTDSTFGRLFAQLMRASAEPETFANLWRASGEYDVSALLPKIAVPTLVIHSKNNRLFIPAIARRMAANILGANMTLIDDDATYAAVPGLIKKFVSERDTPTLSSPPGSAPSSGTAIILFADIVDSTALTERLGDAAFRDKARDLDTTLRAIIREHAGTAIEGKLLGDGVLATFASARQAIEAALSCGAVGAGAGLPLHLGLHAGDVIREDNNVYGGAVNIAARISGLAAPGEVLVSDIVRGLARTSAGVAFEDRGEQALKGVSEPVRVWAVVRSAASEEHR
jgi:class 3 adenylate cyclase